MPVVRPCAICDGPGEGCFFGAFSCRSCAAFFRRSVRDDRQYECRGTGNCSINEAGMRNSCRACRLQRCLKNGMSETAAKCSSRVVQRQSKKADHHHQQLEEGTSDALPNIQDSPPTAPSTAVGLQVGKGLNKELSLNRNFAKVFPPAATISGQFTKSIAKFNELMTAICAQHFGPNILLDDFEQRLTHNVFMELDKLSAPLYLEFVRTHFPEFDSLQKGQKVELLFNFFARYSLMVSYELTATHARKHPPLNDTLEKVYIFTNCIIDGADDCEYFFSNMTGFGREEQQKLGQAMMKRHIHFLKTRYMPLVICPLEFAALTGILFWNTVEKTVEMPRMNKQLEALLLELHQVIGQQRQSQANSSSTASIVRYGTLMTLLWDLTNIADKDLNDVFTTSNLFMDPSSARDYTDMWDNVL